MITEIDLQNFKCFQRLELPLGKLTLLTGFNAAGKSTTTQSLLLLTQTIRHREGSADLWLNGNLLRLGTPGDVLNQAQGKNELGLGFKTEEVDLYWTMHPSEVQDERVLRVSTFHMRGATRSFTKAADSSLLHLVPIEVASEPSVQDAISTVRDVIYVSAVRQVETDVFPTPDDPTPVHANVGSYGEFAPWWFNQYDDSEIDEGRCLTSEAYPHTLRGQVNAWLGELFPGAEANVQPVARTRLIRLELRTAKTDDWRRPSNIGYGLSYAFPVLVAGLCAYKGQVLIVDSPEAHLHPRGQSRIGRFLSHVASAGVQVIVETHSDHVLNGVRLAIRDQVLSSSDSAIYFFNAERSEQQPPVNAVRVDRDGNLSAWPKGFFDQSESDLANLAGWV